MQNVEGLLHRGLYLTVSRNSRALNFVLSCRFEYTILALLAHHTKSGILLLFQEVAQAEQTVVSQHGTALSHNWVRQTYPSMFNLKPKTQLQSKSGNTAVFHRKCAWDPAMSSKDFVFLVISEKQNLHNHSPLTPCWELFQKQLQVNITTYLITNTAPWSMCVFLAAVLSQYWPNST